MSPDVLMAINTRSFKEIELCSDCSELKIRPDGLWKLINNCRIKVHIKVVVPGTQLRLRQMYFEFSEEIPDIFIFCFL